MVSKPLPEDDLVHILTHAEPVLRETREANLFITGGTGFFGKWLLETLAAANDRMDTNIEATVLSRNPERFLSRMPHLAARREYRWLAGNITDFSFPSGKFTHVFHLATAASADLNDNQPSTMLTTIVDGTRRVLDFAAQRGVKRLLLTSSGAVYGTQPEDISHIPESYLGGPDPLQRTSAYAEGKRMAELLCALAPEVKCVIARCFTFIGPHLPLDAHFAAGNFLRDALNGGPIILKGDGQSVRSYLYAADLMIWLLTILIRGQPGRAYNVGSDQALTTLELAKLMANLSPGQAEVRVLGARANGPANRYVPAIERSVRELHLSPMVDLSDSIARTLAWLAESPR